MSSGVDTKLPYYIGTIDSSSLREAMDSDGIATFTCATEEDLLSVARDYGEILTEHRHNDKRGVATITVVPDPGQNIGLTAAALPLHTDCPALEKPPRLVLLWCDQATDTGGDTVVALGDSVVEDLRARAPEALDAFSGKEAAIFRTGTKSYTGPILNMDGDRIVEVRLRFDSCVHYSFEAARALPELEKSLSRTVETFRLSPGTGYALRNDRWFHGRTEFSGERRMVRILIV